MPDFNFLMLRQPVVLLLIFAILTLSPYPTTRADVVSPEIPANYALVAENDLFQLYVEFTTLAFKLVDKRSGYLWHSGLDELLEDDRLNTSWQAFAKSGISIEYLDARAVNKRVSIANSEHTLDVTPIEQGISARVTFQEYGISIGVILQLEAEGVRVEVPSESVREDDPDFRLGKLYIYPFLGAVRGGSVPGYMLLPDGSGSLIRFADTTKADNMMYSRYYGADRGIIAMLPNDFRFNAPYPISYPVFGMAHGEQQNAFLSIVEDGAAYGEVQVHPAGIITNFNFLYHAFIYNETYFQATNRSGEGVTTIQRERNAFDAVIHYRFLQGEEADYVGMAKSYQQHLVNKGWLRKDDFVNPNIGIRLEFLGGDKEGVLLWHRFVPMTTIRQMSDILAVLQLPNPEVIYYGWQPLGATRMPPTSLSLEGSLGSLEELSTLASTIQENGGHFSLYLDPQAALRDEPGYSPRNDLAIAITNDNIRGYNRYANYYFTFDVLQQRYTALANDIASHPEIGLALDSIGSMLYSDFRERPPLNREDAIEAYQTLLKDSSVGFYRPNDYLFGQARAYYDVPLGDNGYIYTSESVPFLPIVLAGYIPYYGTALNFSSNRQDDLLRHIEAGIYPSYFVTHEPTSNMLNTPSGWIYTSSYEQWGEEIRQTYQWMNALLAPVLGEEIVDHKRLVEGVFATTYANGRQIIVNYNDYPFTQGEIMVEAKNALLLETAL